MKHTSLLFLFSLIFLQSSAQTISDDRLKEAFRNRQLVDSAKPTNSLMVDANQIKLADLDAAVLMKAKPVFSKGNIRVQWLPVSLVEQYNSKAPYEWNLGSMLPAKGLQTMISAGVHASFGKHVEIQLAPEFVNAANKNFEGFPLQLNERAWADRYQFWNTSDIPGQLGEGAYTKLFAGQSYIRYNTRSVSYGISTENMWWGPGSRNALIMSTNAPGFLHASIKTLRPIQTGIGRFEGEIIGGFLQSSGILPPRINSVYNGSFVYVPKEEKSRYMSGMVLTWQPKWTKGLFLGIAKASYLYASEISNPLDVLPLQGFFGRAITRTEKTGRKASMGSLFARYVMPAEQAELYMEFGRKDLSLMPWNILQTESYRRAYVVGFRKLFSTSHGAHIQFMGELTQMQAPTAELIATPDSWYTHKNVRQGYTHLGRPIGAGIGPGSNSQTVEIAWVKGLKKLGIQFERVRYNSDYYYYAFAYITDFRRHWIDLSTTFKADWQFKNLLVSAQLGIIRSYNYQWLVIQTDPTDFFQPGNEVLNFAPRVSVRYRL